VAKLIYERAIHVHPETGELSSYWPEHWPLDKLAKKWRAVGSGPFGAGYQNDPNALSGNALEREWLQLYLPEEYEEHKRGLGVDHGTLVAGADPTRGGSGRDPDYFATIRGDRLENTLYLTDFFNKRLGISEQAQFLEDWISARGPIHIGIIEDTSEKGYVWNDLQQVNAGAGTQYNWIVEKAQGRNAVGAKELRFLAMAPRFRSGQIRIPGIRTGAGAVIPDPRWDIFVQEWCSFPSGHDDLLDAAYWCQFAAFGKEPPVMGIKSDRDPRKIATEGLTCERPAHLAYGKPLDQCARCLTELSQNQSPGLEPDSQSVPAIGSPQRAHSRSGIGMGLHRR